MTSDNKQLLLTYILCIISTAFVIFFFFEWNGNYEMRLPDNYNGIPFFMVLAGVISICNAVITGLTHLKYSLTEKLKVWLLSHVVVFITFLAFALIYLISYEITMSFGD